MSNGVSGFRFRLRSKFVVAFTLQTLVIALLIVIIQQIGVRRTIENQTRIQAEAIADSLQATAGYYVMFGLSDDLKGILDNISKNPAIEYADFVSGEGKILASMQAAKRPAEFAKLPTTRSAWNGTSQLSNGAVLYLSVRPMYASGEDPASPSAKPHGYVRLAFNQHYVNEALKGTILSNVLVILLAVVVAAALALLGARLIVRPILNLAETAKEVAGGDLTRRAEVTSNDELGDLANAFNSMTSSLEGTISKLSQSQVKVRGVADLVASRSGTVMERIDEQGGVLDDTYFSIDKLNGGIRKISENVESLSASSEETSSSILQMVASIEEVTRHTDTLFASVEETASATEEMVSSINEVDQNMDFLQNFVTDTSSSMVQMSASIGQVETNAARSYELANTVGEAAESGMKAVRETMDGMEQIRRSVIDSNAVVSRLGDRSTEIGKILSVIEDVAEQTNLLALNAAILAAQAGEQGKGFSVVAAQIRDLSERTATSTKEIATLIHSVQEEVSNVLHSMGGASRNVETGVNLAHEAGRALNRIIEAATRTLDMTREIASATKEQAKGSENVTGSIERVREMVKQINAATTQQATGSGHIMKAVESMREVTRYVRQASTEQQTGSVMISKAAETMIDMVHEIHEVTSGQAGESEKIVNMMERMREIAEVNRGSAAEMADSISLLNEAMRSLEEEVRRFRIRS